MDRSWMYGKRNSLEFMTGVKEFCNCALQHQQKCGNDDIYCPCSDCQNVDTVNSIRTLRDHIMTCGFRKQYYVWVWHGESLDLCREVLETESSFSADDNYSERVRRHEDEETRVGEDKVDEERDEVGSDNGGDDDHIIYDDSEEGVEEEEDIHTNDDDNDLDEMLEGVQDDFSERPRLFEKLSEAANTPLYNGCTKHTKLSAVMGLFNLKSKHCWTDVSFTELLEFLQSLLPEGHVLPNSTYYAKKLMCPLGLDYEKIDVCPNDCVLYRNEYANLNKCPCCGESRYKIADDLLEAKRDKKGPSVKNMWYLPITPRLKRLFSIKNDAEKLRWHCEKRKKGRLLKHPADSFQWKEFDAKHKEFGKEGRNVRLALFTDGMSPFGNPSSLHSTWPVLLVIYNLPPWLCMKRKYMMLSLLISGPKQPRNDIDVYLAPLIEELVKLWNEGVSVFDACANETFIMRAMLFCTINDFPAYGNLKLWMLEVPFM